MRPICTLSLQFLGEDKTDPNCLCHLYLGAGGVYRVPKHSAAFCTPQKPAKFPQTIPPREAYQVGANSNGN